MESLQFPPEAQKALGLVTLGIKPKPAFGEAGQAKSKAGVPKWVVSVAAESGEAFEVTVTSPEVPKVTRFAPVWLDGLTVGGSSRGLWWSATAAKTIAQSDA